MNVELQKVTIEDKTVLQRLLELYQYDFTEYEDVDLNDHGLYGYKHLDHYWTEDGREAFFIRADGKLAGFVMTHPVIPADEYGSRELSEFFVMRKYRRLGVGRIAATRIFDMFPGRWWVQQMETNGPSKDFWRRVIGDYTGGNYEEIRIPDWEGPIQVFYTPGSEGTGK